MQLSLQFKTLIATYQTQSKFLITAQKALQNLSCSYLFKLIFSHSFNNPYCFNTFLVLKGCFSSLDQQCRPFVLAIISALLPLQPSYDCLLSYLLDLCSNVTPTERPNYHRHTLHQIAQFYSVYIIVMCVLPPHQNVIFSSLRTDKRFLYFPLQCAYTSKNTNKYLINNVCISVVCKPVKFSRTRYKNRMIK